MPVPSSRTSMRNPNTRSAFTLIELLVVIAIIALLAAILFPVFSRAREQARKSACASNLKQIGLAFHQYAQDYDERFPHDDGGLASGASAIFRWEASSSCSPQPACLSPFQNVGGSDSDQRWPYRLLPYTKNTQIFQCPSSQYMPTITSLQRSERVGYWANGATLMTPDTSGGSAPRNIASINETANVVMLFDQVDSTHQNMGNSRYLWYRLGYRTDLNRWTNGSTLTTGSAARQGPHNETFNVLWADGHVKAVKADRIQSMTCPSDSSIGLGCTGEAPFPTS